MTEEAEQKVVGHADGETRELVTESRVEMKTSRDPRAKRENPRWKDYMVGDWRKNKKKRGSTGKGIKNQSTGGPTR